MRLRDFLNADIAYTRAENEIREWVETRYPGLSIDFYPHLEIVRTSKRNFSEKRCRKITEVVNIKIGEILEAVSVAQVEGKIASRQDALDFLKTLDLRAQHIK